jgi:flavocytochrome c
MKNKNILPGILAAVLVFAACASKPVFNPGTYQGTGQGFGGALTVEVTVDAGRILGVRVVSHSETASVADPALERIPQAIVSEQTLAVDNIAGVTFTSNAIKAAAAEALEQSGVNMTLMQRRRAVRTAARSARTENTDVVVIGAGGAGLSAARSAQQNGAKVILLEKLTKAGGNTELSGQAFNAVNTELQAQLPAMNEANRAAVQQLINKAPHNDAERQLQETVARQYQEFVAQNRPGLFDSVEWHALQTYNGGDYLGNIDLILTLTQSMPETHRWLTNDGMVWSTSPDIQRRLFTVLGGLWQRANRPEMPLGTGFIDMALKYIAAHNDQITVMYNTEAMELIVQNGRVTGVKARGPNGENLTINAARGVVLATGGFGANKEMRQKYNDMGNPPLWGDLSNAGTTNAPGATGDGIMMAERVGANLVGMEWIQMLPMGDPRHGSLAGNIEMGVQDRFFVNKNGDRFVDEGARRDVMTNALLQQPDAWLWVICDSQSYPDPQTTRNNFGETIVQLLDAGRAFSGNTIDELAAKIDVPAANLRAAFAEFNAGVDAGRDKWGRTLWRIKIDKPPFYAGARVPTVHHTMGGLEINASTQVLNKSGQVIPGLYAAGEVTGGIHGTNRLGGNALADIHTFGRIAGASAAAQR